MVNSQQLPPHDINAEEAVSGSLLIDGKAIYEIATTLRPEDFYSEPNRVIYRACRFLYERDEAINQITVAQELERLGSLETCGGVAYLSHLISIVPTSLDIEHYARIVYRLSIMRQLIVAAERISDIGYQADPDVNAALSRAEEALYQLRSARGSIDFVHIKQVLDRYFETPPVEEIEGQRPVAQVMSGFIGLDEFLDGFQRSDLIIIAGRPSMGKTSLALNIARNAAVEQGACVALFSLEMSRDSLVQRLLSSESGVNLRKLRFEHQTESDERKLMNAIGILSETPIYLDDSPMLRVVEMRSKARRLYYERGIDLIIIDYLQLMQGEGIRGENRVQEISYISRSLKALARELNVPVIAVSQLSRAVEWRASHRPQLADLRESGSIEQDSDIVTFIYRDDYYYTEDEWRIQHPEEEYPEGIAQVIIAKHRNGPTGELSLRFVPRMAKFENIASQEPTLL
ncbi:MAG: replicative DNA helicase [Dehalococcoidales bacterium]|nr:MAG: replicative DNA helicase [Dehalococcoidales bacterium]